MRTMHIEKVIQQESSIDLDSLEPFASGGEGELYLLANMPMLAPAPYDYCVKIYHADMLNEFRQRKISHLCSLYDAQKAILSEKQFAIPIHLANDAQTRDIIGFAMRYAGELPDLDEIAFSGSSYKEWNGKTLNDDDAFDLIMSLAAGVFNLHSHGVVLGDLKPDNVLYDFTAKIPIFVDLDSAKIGEFNCTAYTPDYLDPLIRAMPMVKDELSQKDSYQYNTGSDIFSLAVIAYKLFVGNHPTMFRYLPRSKLEDALRKEEFYIKVLADPAHAANLGITILDHPVNDSIKGRLKTIQSIYPLLYRFFENVFIEGKRINPLYLLHKDDPRHPEYKLNTGAGFQLQYNPTNDVGIVARLMRSNLRIRTARTMSDSDAFKAYVNGLGVDYGKLVSGV